MQMLAHVWVLSTLLSCFVFDFAACWIPLASSNFPEGFFRGSVVDLSDDGRRLAVGSALNNNGDGSVSVYQLDATGSDWHLLVEIAGSSAEGLGNAIAISPDGLLVATRRHHVIADAVQVFEVIKSSDSTSFRYQPLGAVVYCPDDAGGTQIRLTQASLGPLPQYFLLMSCEDFDRSRGLVQAYSLNRGPFFDPTNAAAAWEPYLPALTGANPGDRFGHAIAFGEAPYLSSPPGSTLRMAVASPCYDSERGLVQIFLAEETGWVQLGDDMQGFQEGQQFGFSLSMSATTAAYLAIGSPEAKLEPDPSRGIVQVYHWRSVALGQAPSWKMVVAFKPPGDLLGYSVAMSRDGRRVATSSIRYDSDRGYVALYEREGQDTFRGSGPPILGAEQGDMFGTTIIMNSQGSLVAIVGQPLNDRTGKATVSIDSSPFCEIQTSSTDASLSNRSIFESYIERTICYDDEALVRDSERCESILMFSGGQWTSCGWENRSLHIALPAHSQTPTMQASGSTPSMRPSEVSNHPSSVPSLQPTWLPSVSPSQTPASALNGESTRPSILDTVVSAAPSLSYVEPPASEPTPSDEMQGPFVRVCHCNERKSCMDSSVSQGRPIHLCLRSLTSEYRFMELSRLDISQPDYLHVLVDKRLQVMEEQVFQDCHENFCTATFLVPTAFFHENQSSTMSIRGEVALLQSRILRGLERGEVNGNSTAAFNLNVQLSATSTSSTTDSLPGEQRLKSKKEQRKEKVRSALWYLLGLLGLLCMMACFMHIKTERAKNSSNAT